MAEAVSIDISEIPDLDRLIEEAERLGKPLELRRRGRIIGRLYLTSEDAEGIHRKRSPEDREAFLSSAGSWRGLGLEDFVEKNYESRRISTRPSVEL